MTITNFESSKQIVILCDFCFQEITNVMRIKCECQVDICIRCFYSIGCEYYGNRTALQKYNIDRSKIPRFKRDEDLDFFNSLKTGTNQRADIELKNHSPEHRYYCIEPLNYTVIDKKWTALEELIFFEMLVTYGIGNWSEISFNMKTKTPEEIEKHFYLIFKFENNKLLEKNENITNLSNPNSHHVAIYAPKREDLDFEDEYEYESHLKYLEHTDSQEIKDFLLDAYRNVLLLRKLKRLTIFEKRLTEIEFLKAQKDKMNKTNQQIYDICVPLSPFISKDDLNMLFNGLRVENFLINFKNNQIKPSNDIFTLDSLRKEKASDHEIQIVENLNITYSTYTKIKKFAILSALRNGDIKSLRNFANDKRCGILLKYFKKKKMIL